MFPGKLTERSPAHQVAMRGAVKVKYAPVFLCPNEIESCGAVCLPTATCGVESEIKILFFRCKMRACIDGVPYACIVTSHHRATDERASISISYHQ